MKKNKIIKNLLTILRDFDLRHVKKLNNNRYAEVDFSTNTIRIQKYGSQEDTNSLLHEARHVYRMYQTPDIIKPEEEEPDAEMGSIFWLHEIYKLLYKK